MIYYCLRSITYVWLWASDSISREQSLSQSPAGLNRLIRINIHYSWLLIIMNYNIYFVIECVLFSNKQKQSYVKGLESKKIYWNHFRVLEVSECVASQDSGNQPSSPRVYCITPSEYAVLLNSLIHQINPSIKSSISPLKKGILGSEKYSPCILRWKKVNVEIKFSRCN
jgi:hypothetical protein